MLNEWVGETEVSLKTTREELVEIEKAVIAATVKHNQFLKELGLPPLPSSGTKSPVK